MKKEAHQMRTEGQRKIFLIVFLSATLLFFCFIHALQADEKTSIGQVDKELKNFVISGLIEDLQNQLSYFFDPSEITRIAQNYDGSR